MVLPALPLLWSRAGVWALFALAAPFGAVVAWRYKHAILARATGVEGAGVFTHVRDGGIIAFTKPEKPDVYEFPGGKIEFADVVRGTFAWRSFGRETGEPWPIHVARETAKREMFEETGCSGPVTPVHEWLPLVGETGRGHTDTRQPVFVFAYETLFPTMLVAAKAEFSGEVLVPQIDDATLAKFRNFNRKWLAALAQKINRVVGPPDVVVLT